MGQRLAIRRADRACNRLSLLQLHVERHPAIAGRHRPGLARHVALGLDADEAGGGGVVPLEAVLAVGVLDRAGSGPREIGVLESVRHEFAIPGHAAATPHEHLELGHGGLGLAVGHAARDNARRPLDEGDRLFGPAQARGSSPLGYIPISGSRTGSSRWGSTRRSIGPRRRSFAASRPATGPGSCPKHTPPSSPAGACRPGRRSAGGTSRPR